MRGVLARDESMEVLLVAEADANAIYSDDLRSSSSSLRTQMKKRMTKVVGSERGRRVDGLERGPRRRHARADQRRRAPVEFGKARERERENGLE